MSTPSDAPPFQTFFSVENTEDGENLDTFRPAIEDGYDQIHQSWHSKHEQSTYALKMVPCYSFTLTAMFFPSFF